VDDPDAPSLPADELREVFAGEPDARTGVRVERVYEPVVSASAGIWRVRLGDRSAILKVVAHSEAGHLNWRSGEEPSHWFYWRREVLAYGTGLLRSLPGSLRAPECRLVAERVDGSVALWLEDLQGAPATRWALERYGVAARHLARTQGAYSSGAGLPDDEWLSRGWLRDYLTRRDGDVGLVDDRRAWEHPLVASWFPDPPVERLRTMRRDQPLFLDALDRLPRTLCHLDLHPANLFADGDAATVAVDWAFVGIGAVGEDAGNLVPDSVLDFHVPPDRVDDLYETVTAGYVAGLRDAGWAGDESEVRLGLSATIAAKYSWILPAMLRGAAEGRDTLNRRPIEETFRWWAPVTRFLLDRADEARERCHGIR
jgi:hypothetical protein